MTRSECLSAAPRIVVLGDTRDLHHHGCEAVLAQLLGGLAGSGIPADLVIAGMNWKPHAEACLGADLLVINGEGSLHDNSPVVRQVLELAVRRRELERPTALVNSSWFANDPASTRGLAAFDLVAMRDPDSRREVLEAGIPTLEAPDLAVREGLARRPPEPWQEGTGPVMVSDSTRTEKTRVLRAHARNRGWTYLPVLYPPVVPRPGAKSRKIWRKCRIARMMGPLAGWLMSPRYYAHLIGAPDLESYCRKLVESGGVVTGRFHSACFCVALGVPVLVVSSNTPKIEALLTDARLDLSKRVTTMDGLQRMTGVPPYSPQELESLRQFRATAEVRFEELFAAIRRLLP